MIKHIFSYLPGRLIPAALNFVMLAIYARLLSVNEYGSYALILAMSSFISSVGYIWIRMYLERFYQYYVKENNEIYILNSIKTNFILVSISVIIISISIQLLIPEYIEKWLFIVALVYTILSALFEIILSLYRAKLKPNIYSSLSILKSLIVLVSSFLFLYYLNFGVIGVFISLILGNSVVFVLLIFKKDKSIYTLNRNSIIFNNEFLKYGLPFIMTFLLSYIITVSDRFFIRYFGSEELVGSYSISYDLSSQTLNMLFMVVNLAAYPIIVKALETENINQVKKSIIQYSSLSLGVLVPSTLGFMILSPDISLLVIGNKFGEDVVTILRYTAISTFILGLKAYFSDFSFQLGKRTDLQIYPMVVGAILNICLNIVLIPKFKIIGALYSTLISFTLSLLFSLFLGRKVFKMYINYRDLYKIFFSTIIMYVCINIFSYQSITWFNLILKITVGIIAYGISVYVLNVSNIKLYIKNTIVKEKM
ncbi:oligosaccharide flippase family protein [Lysinibacillus irui]|uniref:oligosaccharide flippase family protein n=1 Tax=Lysinibacillus irui TaxID=2998077 RepID=UPI0038868C3A